MFTTHHSAHHNAHYSAPTTAPPTVPTTAPTIAPTEQRVHKDARSPHAECRRSCLCPQGVSSLLVAGAPLQVHRPKTTSALADCTLLFRITCSPHAGGDCCTRSAATAHPPSTPALHAPARPARAQSASYGRQGAWLLGERSFWIALSLGAGGLPSYTCPWTSRASPLSTHPHRRAAPRAPCSRPRVPLALGPACSLLFWRTHEGEGKWDGRAFPPPTRVIGRPLARACPLVSPPHFFVCVSLYQPPDQHDLISPTTNIRTHQGLASSETTLYPPLL